MTNSCCETVPMTACLATLKAGSRGIIKKFNIDCQDRGHCRFSHRLKEMGLYEGANVEIAGNNGDGEIIAICEGSRIVLGRGMASKIFIEVTSGALMDDSKLGKLCRRFGIGCRV